MGLNHVAPSIEEINKAIGQIETFGHLAPKHKTEYKGWILFTLTAFGDTCIIDFEFNDLESSPWFNTDVLDYITNYTDSLTKDKHFGVFRFEGIYKEINENKFKGSIIEIPLNL